jgi:hypothetical protein
MMENKKIQPAYLDDKVIITMIILSLVALMITAFRYKNYEHCIAFNIKVKAEYYRTGEPIRFETDARNTQDFQWEFGDNETSQTNIPSVVHAYNVPGEYTITLTVNGKCSEYKTIYITRAPKLENPLLLPTFICPQSAAVGKPVTFIDTTAGAHSWEWRFGETAVVDATASTASYVYKTPGLKTIALVINNNVQQMATCKVFVNEALTTRPKENNNQRNRQQPIIVIPAKPNTPSLNEQANEQPAMKEPPKPTGTSISKQDLEGKLRMVASNFFKAEGFTPYLCNNLNIPVSLNGQEITFIEFCNKLSALKSEKKIKELNVQQIKSNETNCIISLNVSMKLKKGFLGLF